MDALVLGKRSGKGIQGGPGATATRSQVGGSWAEGRGGQDKCVSKWEMSSTGHRGATGMGNDQPPSRRGRRRNSVSVGEVIGRKLHAGCPEQQLRWGRQARGGAAVAAAGGPSEPPHSGSAGLGSARLGPVLPSCVQSPPRACGECPAHVSSATPPRASISSSGRRRVWITASVGPLSTLKLDCPDGSSYAIGRILHRQQHSKFRMAFQ